jgi:hypothetical protein
MYFSTRVSDFQVDKGKIGGGSSPATYDATGSGKRRGRQNCTTVRKIKQVKTSHQHHIDIEHHTSNRLVKRRMEKNHQQSSNGAQDRKRETGADSINICTRHSGLASSQAV